ncbi:MAG: histidine--tRNA ligase [Planctomycetes bacterium]|nr:histidine--tRNA ligase [Planctomycetota bacterium]
MAVKTHTFQAPKGTRDFYPQDLAVRKYIESVWRKTAISHGFDEIDGPTFEHLELYTTKSGPGIVSELFSFKRDKGATDYALRPEFTPTLARMYAAQAGSLPKPTKWFSIGPYFRAERPQRGRLREHIQLNVDIIGDDSPAAEAELITTAIELLTRLSFTSDQIQFKISHRDIPKFFFLGRGAQENQLEILFDLTDRYHKISKDELHNRGNDLGISNTLLDSIDEMILQCRTEDGTKTILDEARNSGFDPTNFGALLEHYLDSPGTRDWFCVDPSIVRGLAYYTGTVFEIHETTGKERAIAGGGRYDKLVELFDGPPTAACGFAMGDVVLRLVLEDHGLLKPSEQYLPSPDVFVINVRDEESQINFMPLVSSLRSAGLHVRHSYKSTRNVGKLLSEANKARAKFAVILGKELDEGKIVIKDLQGGSQEDVAEDTLLETLQARLANREGG